MAITKKDVKAIERIIEENKDEKGQLTAEGEKKLAATTEKLAERANDKWSVERYAKAMDAKMELKLNEGFGGWADPRKCTVEHLQRLLLEHIEKDVKTGEDGKNIFVGDPVDIANYCMMIWNRNNPE